MAADSATEAADGAASAPLELSTLCPDALQDSYAAVHSLLVVAPLTALASRWLLSRGKRTTPTQVLLLSLLVPALLIGIPAMSRLETRYVWAQKYAYLRHQFQEGAMPLHVWQQIDSAYDHIYNEKSRFLYDFWGPGQEKLSLRETQLNVGFFYLLWTGIMYVWAVVELVICSRRDVLFSLNGMNTDFGDPAHPSAVSMKLRRHFAQGSSRRQQVGKTVGTLKAIENALSPEEEAEESSEK
ncbi:hypothetical protein BBJ28_00013493 [Nothophytophthora sp. Chile5]|nr:hypothetical protein BBJ28_00013493 [Nothophytophthora sp. Chile5]